MPPDKLFYVVGKIICKQIHVNKYVRNLCTFNVLVITFAPLIIVTNDTLPVYNINKRVLDTIWSMFRDRNRPQFRLNKVSKRIIETIMFYENGFHVWHVTP